MREALALAGQARDGARCRSERSSYSTICDRQGFQSVDRRQRSNGACGDRGHSRRAQRIGNYRLTGATLFVTIEPCQMCVGAMVHARIARVVYGAPEPKAGALESAMRAHEHPSLNHRMEAVGGLLEAECREVIQEFFKSRREESGM